MREKYESDVYLYIDDQDLKNFIKNNNKLEITVTYQNITKNL